MAVKISHERRGAKRKAKVPRAPSQIYWELQGCWQEACMHIQMGAIDLSPFLVRRWGLVMGLVNLGGPLVCSGLHVFGKSGLSERVYL